MKTIKLLMMMAVLSLMAMSCSEEDDTTTTTIAGSEFEVTYFKVDVVSEAGTITMEFDTKETISFQGVGFIVTFGQEGELFFDDEPAGVWSEDGDAITMEIDGDEPQYGVLSGSKLTTEQVLEDMGVSMIRTYIYTKL